MTDVRCPMCGKPNPAELEECQYCGARLKPVVKSSPEDSQTIKPGQEPVKKVTSEFERVKLARQSPIHPGDAPTKKDTAELERALPDWLRSLREERTPSEDMALAEPSSGDDQIPFSEPAPAADSSDSLPDWLAGLDKAGSEDEEVPDWLAGLRAGGEEKPLPASSLENIPDVPADSTMIGTGLSGEPPQAAPEPPDTAQLPAVELPGIPATSEPDTARLAPVELPGYEAPPEPDTAKLAAVELPDFEASPQPPSAEVLPEQWQSVPPAEPVIPEQAISSEAEGLPDWLSGLPDMSKQPDETGGPTGNLPDWLKQPKQGFGLEPESTLGESESVPGWLSNLPDSSQAAVPVASEQIPEWLSNLEEKPAHGPEPSSALIDQPPTIADQPEEMPDWLPQIQADSNTAVEANKNEGDFEVAPEALAPPNGTGPLPDWLTGIERTAAAPDETPALISDEKDNLSAASGETAFALETPDWLTQLNLEQEPEKTAEGSPGAADSENLEAVELPSWVQAMRPLESVVEPRTVQIDEGGVTEQSGPLAGLRGVLPSTPGLGLLRKPPAYSSKLQVSEGHNRYAASLEQLVMGETLPRPAEKHPLISNRLWRWLITVVLFLAVGLPFAGSNQFTPATLLLSSDKGATSQILSGLPANVPVLVAFDYDPALSGELEAVAAPIVDQLLNQGTTLAFISTSPTGPALAEHFLQTASLVNVHQYQSGLQYVNLGYLAGGPAGMLYLAASLKDAMPVNLEGKSPWTSGPLQGIQSVNNFAAVIVLTDNADTGRNWIEQAGPLLGNTPMLMVVSAQAEPMIRPYFDSGQLKGLVSGLADAKIYEQNYNRPGLARHYWNSFGVGMLAAELLIVAGTLLGMMLDQRIFTKKMGKEA